MKFHIPKVQRKYRFADSIREICDYLDLLKLKLEQIFQSNLDTDNISGIPPNKLISGTYSCSCGSLYLGADEIRLENSDGTQYITLKDDTISFKGTVVS